MNSSVLSLKSASHLRRKLLIPNILVAATAIGLTAPMAYPATVLEFGPSNSYVSSTVAYARTATSVGSGPYTSEVAFDSTNPLSPTSGYTGPAFYGGYRFSSQSSNVGFANQGIFNDYAKADNHDALYFNVVGSNNDSFHSTTMSFASVIVFKQDSFSAPFQQGNVSVNGFSISLYRHANGSVSTWFKPEGRWLVEINGTYYLSNNVFTGTSNDTYATFSLSGNDLESTLWAAYDPASNLFFDASSANFGALDLQNISGVGFYIDDASFNSSTGTVGMRLAVDSFVVTTAIPEPASLGFIGLGVPLVAGALSLRKSRREAQDR